MECFTNVSCFRYHKGTDFQANHNDSLKGSVDPLVVLDTTKVQIFKQITTKCTEDGMPMQLFQIPQRYRFSSKSQPLALSYTIGTSCFRYHKGTDFQANHNRMVLISFYHDVVLDTTKVQIFKQITTDWRIYFCPCWLFQIPQRYRFSSKSQRNDYSMFTTSRCFRYHKGTDFQANHNSLNKLELKARLFQIPQRYRFSSKSQHLAAVSDLTACCFRYHKGTDFQANHNWTNLLIIRTLVVLDTTKVQIFKQITTPFF